MDNMNALGAALVPQTGLFINTVGSVVGKLFPTSNLSHVLRAGRTEEPTKGPSYCISPPPLPHLFALLSLLSPLVVFIVLIVLVFLVVLLWDLLLMDT